MKKLMLLLMLCLPMIVTAGCTQTWTNPPMQASLIMSNVGGAIDPIPLATTTAAPRPTRVPVPFRGTPTPAAPGDMTLDEDLIDRIRERLTMDRPTPASISPCSYLTAAKASAILGAAVELDEDEEDTCSYIPASLSFDDDLAFVGLAFFRGAEAVDQIQSLIEDLDADSRRLDRSVQRSIDAAFDQEDFSTVLTLLPDLAVEPESLFLVARPDLGVGVASVEWFVDGMYIRGLFGARQVGELILLIATYPEQPDETRVQPAMDAVLLSLLAANPSTTDSTTSPEPAALSPEERLAACYNISTAQVEAVLNGPVAPETTIDEQYGYCVFTGEEGSNAQPGPDTMPTYGPIDVGQYLALSVWPVGSATDPIMYLSFAVLDHNHSRLGEFLPLLGGAGALEELAEAKSAMPGLSRRFVDDVGDGAFWYWQVLPSDHHLAGIYVLNGSERVVLQALVDPERTEEDVFTAMSDVARLLIAE